MRESREQSSVNGLMLAIGIAIAATALGYVGKSYYERTQIGEEARDVHDILDHCHQTIHQMESVLQRLQSSKS